MAMLSSFFQCQWFRGQRLPWLAVSQYESYLVASPKVHSRWQL